MSGFHLQIQCMRFGSSHPLPQSLRRSRFGYSSERNSSDPFLEICLIPDGRIGNDVEDLIVVVREHIEAELPAVDGGMSLQTLIFKKCLERFPKIHTGENDRNIPYFSCLYKRGDLKKFIKRAESARIENICFRRERERRFAREKIIKRKRIGDVWIQHLFMGQLDIESDRMAARLLCALVGGFHDTGTAAGNDCITQFGDLECEFVRVFVVLVRRCETC